LGVGKTPRVSALESYYSFWDPFTLAIYYYYYYYYFIKNKIKRWKYLNRACTGHTWYKAWRENAGYSEPTLKFGYVFHSFLRRNVTDLTLYLRASNLKRLLSLFLSLSLSTNTTQNPSNIIIDRQSTIILEIIFKPVDFSFFLFLLIWIRPTKPTDSWNDHGRGILAPFPFCSVPRRYT